MRLELERTVQIIDQVLLRVPGSPLSHSVIHRQPVRHANRFSGHRSQHPPQSLLNLLTPNTS